MLRRIKNGKCTVHELYANCSQRIQTTKSLNAFIRVTEDASQSQLEKSNQRYLKGKE